MSFTDEKEILVSGAFDTNAGSGGGEDCDSFYETQSDFHVWPCAVVIWIYFAL